ncbi:amino acid ABC transporter ATP-binding protein [Candidatus Uhrbacteria bacterium]|jgi:polar amino acid transport system ATP-binding protein|nr:amino acid ABC transporter ATP-binding protein [Candidatus Uhrbacteria bacterium]MBT7717192.1 amino acid ABC transporter ATP-binding protein [Candidatus Uhrbacteria bacterium]
MLNVVNVTKRYCETKGIFNISFKVGEGEIICLLGKSGSGKSTLLKTLARIEEINEGSITYTNDEGHVGYVAQEYTLWPHLNVLDNLTLAPTVRGAHKKKVQQEALRLLERFDLVEYAQTPVQELSGGQRQRVAILRAVMNKSKVLLLDEITSALDPELTKSVLDLIRALSKDGYTMVISTHHMSFALSIADRIMFLKDGRVIQDRASAEFFFAQEDPEIKSFILDIAKKDEEIEVFRGKEQYQAYHLGLMRRLPCGSTIYIAGAVGDRWYAPMGDFYEQYEETRLKKGITWKMVMYEQGEIDLRLMKDYPKYNQFRKMPEDVQNPANYNVCGDTVITQIFDEEPTIIQIKNQKIADTYKRFFEELWRSAK